MLLIIQFSRYKYNKKSLCLNENYTSPSEGEYVFCIRTDSLRLLRYSIFDVSQRCEATRLRGYIYIIPFFMLNRNRIRVPNLYKAKIFVKKDLQLLNDAILFGSTITAAKP